MKNKSLITNSCLIGLSTLVLIFLALPAVFSLSGYNCLEGLGYIGGAYVTETLVYISPLFMLLGAIVLLAFSIIALLGNVNVIKNDKFLKAARIINLVATCVIALFAFIAFICLLVEGATPGIGLILNLIFSIGAVACASLTVAWDKK